MNIPIFTSITKNKRLLLFTAITALLLISVLFVNSESNSKYKAVKGVLIEVQSGKDYKQCDIYFVDEHGNMQDLTSFPGVHCKASWSPDGKRITFHSRRDGLWGVYMMDADGSNQRLLYRPDKPLVLSSRSVWRPDGKKIAFEVIDKSKRENSRYKIIDLTEPITKTIRFDVELQKKMPGYPALGLVWSPDGKRIAFIEMGLIYSEQKGGVLLQKDDILFMMDSDGKNKKELARGCRIYNNSFLWSPDSKKIAFVSRKVDARDVTDICIVDVDNMDITNLTKGKNLPFTEHEMPTWSPDSKQIAFVSISNGVSGGGISVINIETLELKRLTEHILDTRPAWSPDGTKIVFLSDRELDLTQKHFSIDRSLLYSMDTNGKNVTKLTNFKHPKDTVSWVNPPVWSPVK